MQYLTCFIDPIPWQTTKESHSRSRHAWSGDLPSPQIQRIRQKEQCLFQETWRHGEGLTMWRSGRRLSRQGSVQSFVASSSFVATHFISLHSGQSGPVHANTQALRNDCISPLACTLSITRPSHFQRARYATAKTRK